MNTTVGREKRGKGMVGVKQYRLMDENGQFYMDTVPGKFGGYRRGRIYGRLDCKSANRAIAKGGYVKYRVFFKDEETAVRAGYRPCAVCMPEKYREWKEKTGQEK